MADNNIRFKIGSSFDGEGFKSASNAIKANQKEIQSSVKGLGELTNAFSKISPEAAGAVGAVKTFASAFATGGIVGGVIELAIKGIGLAVSKMKQHFDEAAEATKTYADILKNNVLAAMGDAEAKFKSIRSEMSQSNKEAADLLKVLNGDIAHEAATKIYQVKMDAFQKITDDMTEQSKAVVTAERDKQISIIKAKAAIDKETAAIETYEKTVSNAENTRRAAISRVEAAEKSLAEMTERCRDYTDERAKMENFLASKEKLFADGHIGLADVLNARKEAALWAKKIDEKYKDKVDALAKATQQKETAVSESADAERSLKDANNALRMAHQRKAEAVNEATLAEIEGSKKVEEAQKKAAEAATDKATADDDFADFVKKLADGYDERLKKNKELCDAEAKLKDATEKAAKDMSDGGGSGGGVGDGKGVKNVKVVNPKDIATNVNINGVREDIKKPKGLDNDTWNRIKNGLANAADMQKFHRFQERDERDRKTQLKRIEADSIKFVKLADTPEVWRSKADRQFMEIYKKNVLPQLPKDMAAKMLGDAGKHILAREDMKDFLSDQKKVLNYVEKLKSVAANTAGIPMQAAAIESAVKVLNEAIKVN